MVPKGFEPSQSVVRCPSCSSHLIKKIPTEEDEEAVFQSRKLNSGTIDQDADEETQRALESSLESARCANMLLQAMSFDMAARGSSDGEGRKEVEPVGGVSYCPECKAHVITDATELERLFEIVTAMTGSSDDAVEEYLRGGIYVVVDEAEVSALTRGRKQKELEQAAASYDYNDYNGSNIPTKPSEFDYPYRHKVATKAMGSKIGQGYKLLEDICQECELPLMESPEKSGSECVVCPKLYKKMAKLKVQLKNNRNSGLVQNDTADTDNHEQDDEQYDIDPDDPISFILAEARRAIKLEKAPQSKANNVSRVAEAKKYLEKSRLKRAPRSDGGTMEANSQGGTVPLTPSTAGSEAVEHKPIEINWDELVINGRALLAERLKQGWTMSSDNCTGSFCKGTPLTSLGGGPDSCVVCGGSGTGFDGAYAVAMIQNRNFKSEEVVEAERALVTKEISYLMTLGWVLRDSLCEKCLMPLVAEHTNAVDLCILCGELPLNNLVHEPVRCFFDENADDAGEKLMRGWTLPESSLCEQCGGVRMIPPNANECGCINKRCPAAIAAAYTDRPTPLSEMGPAKLIGRGYTKTHRSEQHDDEAEFHGKPNTPVQRNANELNVGDRFPISDDLPFEVGGTPEQHPHYDDPSVLSDDMSQVRSVASSALGAILVRLDDAKCQLEALRESGDADPQECAEKQVEIATLIEKLASAAVAMKQIEDIDEY